jgi:hypothetical protein
MALWIEFRKCHRIKARSPGQQPPFYVPSAWWFLHPYSHSSQDARSAPSRSFSPGSHPIVIGPVAFLCGLDLLHHPHGRDLPDGPLPLGLQLQPSDYLPGFSAWGPFLQASGNVSAAFIAAFALLSSFSASALKIFAFSPESVLCMAISFMSFCLMLFTMS